MVEPHDLPELDVAAQVAAEQAKQVEQRKESDKLIASCFGSPAGQRVLEGLKRGTIHRSMSLNHRHPGEPTDEALYFVYRAAENNLVLGLIAAIQRSERGE